MAEPDAYYRQFCMSNYLHVNKSADVATVRSQLLAYLFSGTLPSTGADTIATGVSAFASTDPGSNCASIDKWTFSIGNRLAFNWVYHPAVTPITVGNKFCLIHHGHESAGFGTSEAIKACVDAGLTACEVFMPGCSPDNGNPTIGYGPNTTYHNCTDGPTCGDRYLSPSIRAINQAVTSGLGTQGFHMAGVSGGGWTTTLVAAVDTRVGISYPVSGSYPQCLRFTGPNTDGGDVEQNNFDASGPLFHDNVFGFTTSAICYMDLYLLGACGANRKQVQCLNPGDGHFGSWLWVCYQNLVQGKAAYCGGDFSINVLNPPIIAHFFWQQFRDAFVADVVTPLPHGRFRRR